MKVIDVLVKLDEQTRIKVYSEKHECGILYISPLSNAIRKTYELEVEKLVIRNDILHIYTLATNK